MDNMLNKHQNHSDEDESMRLRMEILNKLSPKEQYKVKKGFGPQMRLTPFYEAQVQRRITEQSTNAIHINAGWDFGSGTDEQQDEFQEDFLSEFQQLEIRILNMKNKKHKPRKHQRSLKKLKSIQEQTQLYYNNQVLDNHLGPLFSQMNYPGPQGMGPDQSNTKLRSRQPTSRRKWIVSPTQTNSQSQITPNSNQNQSLILNIDLIGIITNPFSVPKGIQHQKIAGEAAQVQHALRETFSTNGNVRKVASPQDSIVSGQVGVAGTRPINIRTASSTKLQGNPIHEPQVANKSNVGIIYHAQRRATNISFFTEQSPW
ncbi:MAG: hypothetical protein EZS28_038981, partial [Streblomastix strix]